MRRICITYSDESSWQEDHGEVCNLFHRRTVTYGSLREEFHLSAILDIDTAEGLYNRQRNKLFKGG